MLSVKNTSIIAITVVAAILVMAPVLMSIDNHMADAKKHHGKHNHIDQKISQKQKSHQHSQCVSGKNTDRSCNNLSFQNQHNKGNNAAAEE